MSSVSTLLETAKTYFRILHLGNHRNKGGMTGRRYENDGRSSKPSEEGRVANDGPSEIASDLRWSGCWTITNRDCDCQDENGGV